MLQNLENLTAEWLSKYIKLFDELQNVLYEKCQFMKTEGRFFICYHVNEIKYYI